MMEAALDLSSRKMLLATVWGGLKVFEESGNCVWGGSGYPLP